MFVNARVPESLLQAVSMVFARAIVVLCMYIYRNEEREKKRERHVVTVDSAPGAEILSPLCLWNKIPKERTWSAWTNKQRMPPSMIPPSDSAWFDLEPPIERNNVHLKFYNSVTKRTTYVYKYVCLINVAITLTASIATLSFPLL